MFQGLEGVEFCRGLCHELVDFMTCDTWSESVKLESNTTLRFLSLCAGDT